MRPRLGHGDARAHPEQGVGVSLCWIHCPRSRKDAGVRCVDLGALGWKRKRPKKEASKHPTSIKGDRARGSAREEPSRGRCQGGGAASGAQGCPEAKQEASSPAGHQQPWQWQVPTKGHRDEKPVAVVSTRRRQGESVWAQAQKGNTGLSWSAGVWWLCCEHLEQTGCVCTLICRWLLPRFSPSAKWDCEG